MENLTRTTTALLRVLDMECPWCRVATLEVAIGDDSPRPGEYVRCRNITCTYIRKAGSFPHEPDRQLTKVPSPARAH